MKKFSTLRVTSVRSLSIALLASLVLGSWNPEAQAQVANYTFANSGITYTGISGTAMTAGTGWDDNVQSVALGFTFKFNCIDYTSVNISTNGFVTFGSTAPSTTDYNPISGTTAYAGAASAFGRDMINNAVAVTYLTAGTSPNRTFTVQWTNARRYNAGAVIGDVLNFQIRLVETSNVIQLDYGTNTATSTTALTCQVGLRGATNADFNNRTATTTWSTTTAGGTNASSMTSTDLIMPSSRRYTYTPAACPPANDLVCNAQAIVCGSTTAGTTVNATTTGTFEGTTTCGVSQSQPAV